MPPLPESDRVDELAGGYQASQILFTSVRLGVFQALAEGPLTADRMAERLEADRRGTRILCDALVALGLLEKGAEGYRNAAPAREQLLADSPRPRRHQLLHGAKLYERWAGLFDAVKTGRPVPDEALDPRLVADDEAFARAMGDLGLKAAEATRRALDLDGVGTLLDLGGGPGRYAIDFARSAPNLRVVLLDGRAALEVAAENLRQAGLEDRVELREGDAFEDELGGPFDLIFCSNLIHIYSSAENRRLVRRCARALAHRGRLAIKDFLLDDDLTSPAGGAVFAVNMLVSTAGGESYSLAAVRQWAEEAGLRIEDVKEVATRSRLLVARKP